MSHSLTYFIYWSTLYYLSQSLHHPAVGIQSLSVKFVESAVESHYEESLNEQNIIFLHFSKRANIFRNHSILQYKNSLRYYIQNKPSCLFQSNLVHTQYGSVQMPSKLILEKSNFQNIK